MIGLIVLKVWASSQLYFGMKSVLNSKRLVFALAKAVGGYLEARPSFTRFIESQERSQL